MSEQFVSVAKTNEIPKGSVKVIDINDKRILICNTADGFFAVDDTCTHDDGPLGNGWLEGFEVECPRHGARFNVKTGKVTCLPAAKDIQTYSVKIEADEIKINVG